MGMKSGGGVEMEEGVVECGGYTHMLFPRYDIFIGQERLREIACSCTNGVQQ
jgi:hypothetical protein